MKKAAMRKTAASLFDRGIMMASFDGLVFVTAKPFK
jgi:hypothetical protein